MLCPGMGWSPPAEVDAPVSAALDGLVVLEKARAAEEGRVRIDEDAIAVAADALRLLCAADAAAREKRAAAQRATLGAILVSEWDMVAQID